MTGTRGAARWWIVVVFAAGMAWVEAACVYYLRVLVDRVVPYQANPLPIHAALGPVELVREAGTLVMLGAVGMLAGRTRQTRVAYAAIAFGTWDILYYVFLKGICGWPASPLDWDVLFLLPLPWWGPVVAPAAIALLLIVWGTLVTRLADRGLPVEATPRSWVLAGAGAALALYTFMAESLWTLVGQGLEASTNALPARFNWPLFAAALALMAVPVAQTAWRARGRALRRATSPPCPRLARTGGGL